MKILHITNAFSEGGVESLLCDILPLMVASGHEIHLLVLNKNQLALKNVLENKGVRVLKGKYASVYNPLNIFVIKSFLSQYDLVHIHLFPVQYFAVFAKWLLGKKKVNLLTTEHNTYNNRRKYFIFKALDRLIYRNYQKVISVSKGAAQKLKEWSGTESRVIYNGVNIQRFNKEISDDISRHSLNIPENAFLVVMVARFSEQKDQESLIKALKLLPLNCYLLLVGSGDRVTACRELAQQSGVIQRIRFVGYSAIPASYIKISDVGVLATHYEGFGISALEYMILGKPTIVTDIEGLREVVADAALLVEENNEEDLAAKINSLMEDRDLYDKMKTLAVKRANAFSIEETVDQYLDEYKGCFNTNSDGEAID